MATVFLLLILITSGLSTIIAAIFVGPAFYLLIRFAHDLIHRARRFSILHLLGLTTFCAAAILAVRVIGSTGRDMVQSLALCCMFGLAATPTLNLLVYLRASLHLRWQSIPIPSTHVRSWVIAWMAWLYGAIGIFRASFLMMLNEYAKLPTTNPNCYVSCAARYAHPWLRVMCEREACTNAVSLQTKRLKFFELCLLYVCPWIHHWIRRGYDYWGPPMANWIAAHRVAASLAYLMLKPIEWLSESVRALVCVPRATVSGMYADAGKETQTWHSTALRAESAAPDNSM